MGKEKIVIYIFVEVLLFICVSVPLIALQFTEPFQRGFFPRDQSIAYPSKPNTIPIVWAGFFGLAAPLLPIFIIEIYLAYRDKFPRYDDSNVYLIFIQLYKYIGFVAFSFLSTMMIVNVAKETLGSLRPFFLEACRPINSVADTYHAVINCSADNAREIEEARVSFPSGHSACAAWGAAMTIFYLQIRFPKSPLVMLKTFYQCCITLVAFFICLTRIQDNWHRAADVIVGALIGILAAAMVFLTPTVQSSRLRGRESTFTPRRVRE
ncbi:hypothetical protein Aperf_G00000088644 [Anoplocephala perfoliata]